jgi:hypothetical protein
VLEHLLIRCPEAACRLLKSFTAGFIDVSAEDAGTIAIQTQVETGHDRPDLEIRVPGRLAWIEVKAESELRAGQLEGYRELLRTCGVEETRLVLLTRFAVDYSQGQARPDFEVRWFELADWLEEDLPAIEAAGEVTGHLARQFLDFLKGRGMTLTQVGKYLPEGIRALGNLMNMLSEAASNCKVTVRNSAGSNHMGLHLDKGKYWIGIDFSEPEWLLFGTSCRIDPESATKLGIGELSEESWVPGRSRWWRSAELDSEEIHFFSRSKVSQMEWLEGFVRECLTMARSIETPDQPPIPEDPEKA